MTRIWICGPDRIKSRVLRIQTAAGYLLDISLPVTMMPARDEKD